MPNATPSTITSLPPRRDLASLQAVPCFDAYRTSAHARTVARYSAAIAAELGFGRAAIERVRLAGLLHDVGKLLVPAAVVGKAGPLDDEEWALMRRHPELGAELLGGPGLGDVREWVLAHHERPDGRGYPFGAAGDEIPMQARVVSVADAFDAMTAARCYKPAFSAATAVRELRRGAGSQFDPAVVAVMERVLDDGPDSLAA